MGIGVKLFEKQGQFGVQWSDVGDGPSRVKGLDVGAAHAARDRTSASWGKGQHQEGGVGGGNGIDLPRDRLALRVREAVNGSEIQHKLETGLDTGSTKRGDVAVEEADINPRLTRPFSGAVERFGHGVDTGHVPSPDGQRDGVNSGATTEIKHASARTVTTVLFAIEHRGDLFGGRELGGELLPRGKADLVKDPVKHTHGVIRGVCRGALGQKQKPDANGQNL